MFAITNLTIVMRFSLTEIHCNEYNFVTRMLSLYTEISMYRLWLWRGSFVSSFCFIVYFEKG